MRGLIDPYLKIGWAKKHLDTLNSDIEAFKSGTPEPYTFTREDDIENQRHILRVKIADVPDHIPLRAGDAFYNMRSTLDQLAFSLAWKSGDPAKNPAFMNPILQFPIIEVNNSKGRRRFSDQTTGIPDLAIDEIRLFQPYHRGASFKAHPLWRLNEMCNLDKHRRIPASGSSVTFHLPKAIMDLVTMETFYDGGVISIALAHKDKLQLHPDITFEIIFGGDISGITEKMSDVWDIYNFVNDIVLPRFMRFFP